jgi:hypothetical protein
MSSSYGPSRSIASLPAVMFVASMAIFAQSFVVVKVFFLALFLAASIVHVALGNKVVVYSRLASFYLVTCVAGIVWAIVGLLNPSNYVLGVFDALRLYVIWSIAFLVLYSLLRSEPSLGLMHASMVLSGMLISTINLVGLADQIGGWGLIPEDLRQDLELRIGIHEGYIQITSHNIGSLFLIAPYLLSLQFRTDGTTANTWLTKLTLVMCLILTAVSGRRALWLVVALTPCLILVLSIVTGSHGAIRAGARRFLHAYTIAALVGVGFTSLRPESMPEIGYVSHLKAAFSSEDERTIQKAYLIDSFRESPILGSGFGAHAGYLRSEERPWTYELTYHQLLFNLGIVGLVVLGGLVSVYFVFVTRLLRQFKDDSAIPFALLVGLCSLLIGAYSNPYFGSFGFLFFVGLLPYLSTFRLGFDRAEPAAEIES